MISLPSSVGFHVLADCIFPVALLYQRRVKLSSGNLCLRSDLCLQER